MDSIGPYVTAGLLAAACAYGTSVVLLADWLLRPIQKRTPSVVASIIVFTAAAIGALGSAGFDREVLLPLLTALIALALLRRVGGDFSSAGRLFIAASGLFLVWGMLWGGWFVATLPISTMTRGLMLGSLPLLVVTLPIGLLTSFEELEVLCREHWRRPRRSLPEAPRSSYPRASIHVPTHAEPPTLVIATLDALARLRYPNYEVLVIDNNTVDPALWVPVADHCRRLGTRFRFYHLDEWPGAKAGALNFALAETDPAAEIVGIVDADYLAEPDWLARLVGYFDDLRMGFVQPPHAYREWNANPYLEACNWEYSVFFATTMPSLNERMAAITVGTMCLIRREALEQAGGWAEWCATEDSELAIRIHALGYSSVYINEVFGRGLIPDTFAGYKKQRNRWTVGPVQELKRHWRLFLPRRLGVPSALSVTQKLHHLNHGLQNVMIGLGLLLMPMGLAIAASLLAHGESIRLPFALWLAMTVNLVAGLVLQALAFKVVLRCRLRQALQAALATQALAHTKMMGSLRGLFASRIPWSRTNKFKADPIGLGALKAAWVELALGLSLLTAASIMYAVWTPRGLLLMLIIGGVLRGLGYLAAPAMVILAERQLRAALADSKGHSPQMSTATAD